MKLYEPLQKSEEQKPKTQIKSGNFKINPRFCSEVTLITGKRGSGKSHTAGVIAEEMYKQNIQFIFFDTQNANQGLLNLPNVRKVSLNENAVNIAKEVNSSGQSIVIENNADLDKYQEWVSKFLNTFMNEARRGVRTIFFDEIHLLCPLMKKTPCSMQILRLVTTMRSTGIGVVMITQRPATCDTTIINQADNLFLHKVSGLRDLEILKELMSYEIFENREIKELVINTRNFKAGECVIISDSLKIGGVV